MKHSTKVRWMFNAWYALNASPLLIGMIYAPRYERQVCFGFTIGFAIGWLFVKDAFLHDLMEDADEDA